MDLNFSREDEEFREEVRTWLRENVPAEQRPDHDGDAMREFDLSWQRRQYEGGWAGISWPSQYGGQGLSLIQQMIWHEEYAKADAPHIGVCFVGIAHCGPTLIARGSDEQKQRHLPRILRGDVVWCQGFSEPNAGSDLASLQTRGVIDGDELVVNGQKIWTSYAHVADYQELLVRTAPEAEKHKGITWIILDMDSPGVEVRTIETLHGRRHFCEVFYDDVRVPLSNVVGEMNAGWSVAMATLSFERGTAFMAEQVELARKVEGLLQHAKSELGPGSDAPAIDDDGIRRELASLRAEVAALRAMTYAGISRVARTSQPGPEASMIRLFFTELQQRFHRVAMDVMGAKTLHRDHDDEEGRWADRYLDSLRYTITAGTKDIQRNIIGERVLGLPRGR